MRSLVSLSGKAFSLDTAAVAVALAAFLEVASFLAWG